MISTTASKVLYTVLLIVAILVTLYLLLYYRFDPNIEKRQEELALQLNNDPMQSLINGSDINNIPKLNILTTNEQIATVNKCGESPINIGSSGTKDDCVKICSNSNANLIQVYDGETYTYNNTVLQKGANCVLGSKPECNMNMSVAVMTLNSITCLPKYPELVGGPLATTVIACNNSLINNPKNVLWDFGENTRFDPMLTLMTDADELLPDGNFRFRCKFEGTDSNSNAYIQHPQNRLHPIKNYCANLIYAAHPDVKTVFTEKDFTCDCGNFEETRVKHVDENDPKSQCSDKVLVVTKEQERTTYKIPYNCFTINSPLHDVLKMPPCPGEQFTRQGSRQEYLTFMTSNSQVLYEHPGYLKMPNKGLYGFLHE